MSRNQTFTENKFTRDMSHFGYDEFNLKDSLKLWDFAGRLL